MSDSAVAIGYQAGSFVQLTSAVAIGENAGYYYQNACAIAIGQSAGRSNQKECAIAIGKNAGSNNQVAYSTVINSTGSVINCDGALAHLILCAGSNNVPTLSSTAAGFYVKPIQIVGGPAPLNGLSWDSTSGEIFSCFNKTFIINHPLDPAKYLVHACLEGPEAGVYYRGTAVIPAGANFVELTLPAYVDALASEFTVHLTPSSNHDEPPINFDLLVASGVRDGKFRVYRQNPRPLPQPFAYLVMANRFPIQVEPKKAEVEVKGTGPYKWI